MKKRYVIGLDLGTTAIKVGIFDENGTGVGVATCEHKLITPEPLYVEQSAEAYWNAFATALNEALEKASVDKEDIKGLSISAQGETLVFLDENGHPLHNFIVWMDTRAQEESEELLEHFGRDTLLEACGQTNMIPLSPAPKMLWFRRHYPELFEKAAKVMLIEDYFFYRLGGYFCGEGSLWCTSFLWNINTHQWWQPMADYLQVEGMLPELKESGTVLGNILPEAADELGLSHDLKLVMGGLDQACGAIGVGNVRPGIFSESTGAALVIVTMTDHITYGKEEELSCFYSAIPGMYMIHAFGSGGIAYKWLRDALCEDEIREEGEGKGDAYYLMDKKAAQVAPGSEGLVVLPHFQGSGPPDTNDYVKCMMYGLGLQHTKGHVIRAFMEGVAMTLRRMVEASERLMGAEVTEIRSHSGGAKSRLWCQIKSDAMGKPVVVMNNTQDAACLGAAFIAGAAIGIWPSVAEAADMVVRPDRRYEPDKEKKPVYDEVMRKYMLFTGFLKETARKL